MTFIQPKKNSRLFPKILAALVIPIILGVFGLIIIYNQNVSLSHDISKIEGKIREIENANSQVKEKIFSLLNNANIEEIAASGQLVTEKNPEYFSTNKQWAFASQQ